MKTLLLVALLLCLSPLQAQLKPSLAPVPVEGVRPSAVAEAEKKAVQPVVVSQTDSQAMITIAGLVLTFLGTIFASVMTYFMARLNVKATSAAVVLDTVHGLVNNNMRIALQGTAVLARRIADMTGKAKDAEIADAAEQAVRDHDAGQLKADADAQSNDRRKAGR